MKRQRKDIAWIAGDSRTAQLLRSRAWQQTPLGPVDGWSSSLKTALGILLQADCPMFCVWGRDRVLFYNDACADSFWGNDVSVSLGQPLGDPSIHLADGIKAAIDKVFLTGQPLQQVSDRLVERSQQPSSVQTWSFSPIWDEMGQVGGVFASTHRAVDPQKPAETRRGDKQQQAPSEKDDLELQKLANSLSILLAYVDRDRRYRFVNNTYINWFGVSPEEVIGKHVEEVIGTAAYRAIAADIDAVLSGQKLNSEQELYFETLGWRYVQRCFVPDVAEDGTVRGYYALVTDITDYRRTEDSLHQREAELQLVTDALPVLVAFVDNEQHYRFNNQTYETWFGFSPTAHHRRHIRDVVGEAGYAIIRPYIEQALAGQTVTFEQEIPFPTGGTRIVEATYVPRFGSKGAVDGFVALIKDISDRKRYETERAQAEVEREKLLLELAAERAQFEAVLRQMPEGVMIAEAASEKLILANAQTNRILQHDYELGNALNHYEALVPFAAYDVNGNLYTVDEYPLTRSLRTGEVVLQEEMDLRFTNGSRVIIDVNSSPIFNSQGKITSAVAIFQDVTERHQAEATLRQREEQARLAMEGAQMATWDVDLTTGKAFWSERHFEMLGYPPIAGGEASEAMWDCCLHPDDREHVLNEWQQAREENRSYRAEYRIIRADNGEVSWLEGIGNFKYNDQGQAVRSTGVLFDINDRKRGEAKRRQAEKALREQRAILEAILRQAADAIMVCDAQGQLVFVNREARRLAQVDPEDTSLEIDWLAWGSAYDNEGNAIPIDDYCLSKALRGEATSAFESRMVREDGSYYDILIGAVPLWNERQQIMGAVATFIDISDRKQSEEALRESEARFRHMADGAPMLIWMSGTDKRCSYFNQTWLNFTGRTFEQEYGDGWIEGVHPEDLDHCVNTYNAAFDDRREFEIEYRLRRHDGEYRWILDVGTPRFTANGEFLGYIGSCFDIHDRKQAEAALQESEERFRTLADNISQFAWMMDEHGWIFWYNQRWFDYTGSTLEQMEGWQWQSVHHPDHVDRVVQHLRQSVETGVPWEDIFPLRSKEGTYRWFLSRALPIRDESGKILRWFGTNTDITERKQAEEALAQREAELRLVTNAVPALISFVDAEQRYRFNNRRYETWFGQPPEATYGKHLREVLGEAAYNEIRPYVEQVLAGEEVTFESQIPYQEGGMRYISATYVPRFTSAGRVSGFVALVSDISDRKRNEARRKRAEADLRKSEERLRLAQQAAGAGLWDWDMANDQVTWSEEYYALYGLDLSVAPSYDAWIASILPEDQERVSQTAHEAVEHCQNLNVEFRTQHPVKGLRWIAAIGQTFYDADGQPTRMTGIALDITEQKRFEQALIASEALAKTRAEELTAIMETTPAAIWLAHDPQCHNITGNYTAYELMRMAPGAVSTATAADGSNPLPFKIRAYGRDVSPAELPMQKAARDRQEVTGELEFVFEDGVVRYIYGKSVPLFESSGKVRGAIGGFVDITALKQSEQERERLLQRERQAREEAEHASRVKDEFLAILSHELRSPLNPILGWSSLLRQGRLNADKTEVALETIERNAKLQIQLIDDLLDISRIIRGKLSLTMAPTNLQTAIAAAIETVRLAAEAKGIPIQTQFETSPIEVLGDSARLQQVIWNLLSNAVKFTPEGGRVTITLSVVNPTGHPTPSDTEDREATAQYAQIQVIDTGKGIPASFLPHVFEYFRQADSTTTRTFGGLGLGLAIVRYLVELHGGMVQAASPGEGQGATFTVHLPLRPNQSRSLQSAEPQKPQRSPLDQKLRFIRVLMVDDDPDTREFISFALEQQGAIVTQGDSACKAIEAFREGIFDIIVSDIGMPEMDGLMMMRQIRQMRTAQNQNIPAIALTAYATEGDRNQALAAGFQQHIPKPVELDHLVESILQLTQSFK